MIVSMETFGDYALIDAPAVARIFLPLLDDADSEETVPWRALQGGATIELDGNISCIDYLQWGIGNGSFPTVWRPSGGLAPRTTIDRVAQLLASLAGSRDRWVFQPFPQLSFFPETAPSGPTIDLDTFVSLWTDHSYPGSLSFGDSVLVSAPVYADSVIVSGPSGLVEAGKALGLEIEGVAKDSALPTMIW